PEALRDVALAAEAAGVAQLWLWEDCFCEGGLTSATAALAATERLHVAVGLLPVPLRNPALAAMEIATVARMFPGRFLPGLGHGVLEWMEQVGARAASPLTLLREYTAAVRDLLHGRTVDIEGRYVRLREVALDWPPEPPPPLLVGGRGPKTVARAGELAEGAILDSALSLDQSREGVANAAAGRAAAGRAAEPFDTVVFVEVDPGADDLEARIDSAITTLAGIGADTVVFHPTGQPPDPLPLIAAHAKRQGPPPASAQHPRVLRAAAPRRVDDHAPGRGDAAQRGRGHVDPRALAHAGLEHEGAQVHRARLQPVARERGVGGQVHEVLRHPRRRVAAHRVGHRGELGPVGVRADHDAAAAVAVDRFEHEFSEAVEHLLPPVRVDARVGGDVVEHRV